MSLPRPMVGVPRLDELTADPQRATDLTPEVARALLPQCSVELAQLALQADLAFHRTLGGLRHVLEAGGWDHGGIRFHNDRYRLDPAVVGWSDVAEFMRGIDKPEASSPQARLAQLEATRALYRGEYLDDCPFYGDSAHVERRRASLRARFIDLLVTLGEGYEALGARPSASAAYRDALAVATDGCAPAEAGLVRLERLPPITAVLP